MTLKTFLRAMIDIGLVEANGVQYSCPRTYVKLGHVFTLSLDHCLMIRPHHMEGRTLVDAGNDGDDMWRLDIP